MGLEQRLTSDLIWATVAFFLLADGGRWDVVGMPASTLPIGWELFIFTQSKSRPLLMGNETNADLMMRRENSMRTAAGVVWGRDTGGREGVDKVDEYK